MRLIVDAGLIKDGATLKHTRYSSNSTVAFTNLLMTLALQLGDFADTEGFDYTIIGGQVSVQSPGYSISHFCIRSGARKRNQDSLCLVVL